MITEVSHRGNEGQLLKIVKEEQRYVEDHKQHCDEILEECQVGGELLEYLLKEYEYEDVIADGDEEVSQALVET